MIDLLKLICLDDGHGPIHVYLPLPTISNPQSHTKLFLFPFSFLFIYFSIKKKLLISQQILIIVFHHVFVWCIGGSMGLDTINYLYLLLKKKGVVVFLMMLSYN